MEIRPLPADEAVVRRYVEELWLPYHRELEAAVDAHSLAEDVDLVARETEFRLDRVETEGYRMWIAIDGTDADEAVSEEAVADETVADESVADGPVTDEPITDETFADGGDLAGFVTANVDEASPVFDRPDRLVVGDVYVREPYRGTDLARDLIDRCVERARETGCGELALDVDVDNERAIAFYDKLGFETLRHRMTVPRDEL